MSKRSRESSPAPSSDTLQPPKRARSSSPAAADPPPAIEPEPQKRLEPSPACPGILKKRPLSYCRASPVWPEILNAVVKAQEDAETTDAEVFTSVFPLLAKYTQSAPIIKFDPQCLREDLKSLDLHESRVPNDLFQQILDDMSLAQRQYGEMPYATTEEGISRYFAAAYSRIVALFGGALVNRPQMGKAARIESRFEVLSVQTALLVQTRLGEAIHLIGPDLRKIQAEIFETCVHMDWRNAEVGAWVLMLLAITDGIFLEFMVYDSSSNEVFAAADRLGITCFGETETFRLECIKRTLERLLDWFLMAFINGARAKFHGPKQRSERDPEIWEKVIQKGEDAHWALRKGTRLPKAKEWILAEEFARTGIELLSEYIMPIPTIDRVTRDILRNRRFEIYFEETVKTKRGPIERDSRWC